MMEKMQAENISETQESLEGREMTKLTEGYSKEIKTPHDRSYLKKLQRIAGAFVLAGISVFGADKQATAPELSDDFLSTSRYTSLEQIKNEGKINLYRRILNAVSEKGGIEISPQVPETKYKIFPGETKSRADEKARSMEVPYFSKPEVILGEKFIRENPEKAKEYLEKIEEGLKANIIINTKKGQGSGVIVDGGDRNIFLTNAHVVGDYSKAQVGFISGIAYEMTVSFVDKERDLAILEFPEYMKSPEIMNSPATKELIDSVINENGAVALKLVSDEEIIHKGDMLASIGNPLGFPFEVFINKFEKYEKHVDKEQGFDYLAAKYKSDSRFHVLSKYFVEYIEDYGRKGDVLQGMSGGAVINLEKPGKPKLIGINARRNFALSKFSKNILDNTDNKIKTDKEKWKDFSLGVSSPDIDMFIQRYKEVLSFKDRNKEY
ncbi:hypothetical protein A3I27_04055 [Candidatus Giovannonibacteria bacterium RIFCSPLOWO2_02_FULL_43_11b]|uniref:Serine protease n=1 Tax=Candidatus Giovannonibacteria bacterium RIFCSPHIGHO2_12_FULL_43_15 TaxID=1798341 RepID=A0A1F5WQL2_9BACT|nr:MAG: hypothetical protein A2739_02660 [Candidatus Giovannonibacteria bacterium RIFCSPHIGHO2_01_FULL_43_100]OGF67103.1 MAG: hypothetical protein A3B97_04170 [Candidatus Giovannonibacteria bacterium RIFCSPHIGHO2_02_FULL_43_32]OGF77949.1 MAG: hypothetical protein A3F23_03870 [Candidatus Giovannonibacteria bacterium RIFCSPHIGHO2_12_FULL_43_15]OGF79301.1 MAG: hypothetical protein A3A15_01515 [Candidatus Giovannonibacteria bacterium RIFCSPLOWO2_01_FULL_43_60]OGF89278.1 MAG: hypothetical protein A3